MRADRVRVRVPGRGAEGGRRRSPGRAPTPLPPTARSGTCGRRSACWSGPATACSTPAPWSARPGYVATYRKLHLPCLGVDRFTDPGDRPFAVHDLGGLRVGIAHLLRRQLPRVGPRAGAARGRPGRAADQLGRRTRSRTRPWSRGCGRSRTTSTTWPSTGSATRPGYHYVGHSSVSDYNGDFLAYADHDREAILYAEIDPEAARKKQVVHCAGEYEIDRRELAAAGVVRPARRAAGRAVRGAPPVALHNDEAHLLSQVGLAVSRTIRLLDEQHLAVRRQRPQVVGDHRLQLVAERAQRRPSPAAPCRATCLAWAKASPSAWWSSALSSAAIAAWNSVDRRRSASSAARPAAGVVHAGRLRRRAPPCATSRLVPQRRRQDHRLGHHRPSCWPRSSPS